MGYYDPPDDSLYEPRCERCKQEPCECCIRCGAGPDQACEPECGLTGFDADSHLGAVES